MRVIPFVHEGLGNSSYMVAFADGSALVVDPDRSVRRYLDHASAEGLTVAGILETHLHADFVSGALELASATGATIYASAEARLAFPHVPLLPGDHLPVSGGALEAVATPGHTPEHLAYVLRWRRSAPVLFSGGSLLPNGAARTDLVSPLLTDELTRAQYRSLKNAFRDLPDEARLLPTHGGGSFCSAGEGGGRRTSTLGAERASNPLLGIESEDEFARVFPLSFPAAPDYFFRMRPYNQAGARLRSEIVSPPVLGPAAFDARRPTSLVVDVRPQARFMSGHIPGALSNALRDSFATWLGWLAAPAQPLLFVTGGEALDSVIEECLLVGHERFAGVLEGGMEAWKRAGLPVESADLVDVERARQLTVDGILALDVREPGEFRSGHIPGAAHIPLGQLERRAHELLGRGRVLVYCGHGERSATALSILRRAGVRDVINLDGGMGDWRDAGLEVAL